MNGFARRIVGNAVVLATLASERQIGRASRANVDARRDDRVRRTIRYAARHVPHYRDHFRAQRIDPRDIRTAADLEHLPLLEKAQVRRDPKRFVSESWRGRSAIPFLTSGSTGERTLILHDRRSLLENIAYSEREREVLTAFIGMRYGYREAIVTYNGGTLDRVSKFYADSTWFPGRPSRIAVGVECAIEENAARLAAFDPHVLQAYGSYLVALHRAALQGRIAFPRARVVLSVAEGVPPEVCAEIERVHRLPVVSAYNAVEFFKIAFQCERRDGFHVHEDLAHVRIVDEDGRTAPAGVVGDILITNLVNRGTVLINYRLGDRTAQIDTPCACGRVMRRLVGIDGRVEDILHLSNGRVIHPRGVWGLIKGRDAVSQYQLVQTEATRFSLRVVVNDEPTFRTMADDLRVQARSLLGDGMHVDVERVASVPRSVGGKVRMVVALKSADDP